MNLSLGGVFNWFNEVNVVIGIMGTPKDHQMMIVNYKLCARAGAWWDHINEG